MLIGVIFLVLTYGGAIVAICAERPYDWEVDGL